jgi:hypothetical protein
MRKLRTILSHLGFFTSMVLYENSMGTDWAGDKETPVLLIAFRIGGTQMSTVVKCTCRISISFNIQSP